MHPLRKRYREPVRGENGQNVGSGEEGDEELEQLRPVVAEWARTGPKVETMNCHHITFSGFSGKAQIA